MLRNREDSTKYIILIKLAHSSSVYPVTGIKWKWRTEEEKRHWGETFLPTILEKKVFLT